MKLRRFSAFILAAALLLSSSAAVYAETLAPPETVSEAYCVMDAATGQVLIQKNMYKIEYPASITKILSAALALEYLSPSDRYTFTEEAATYDITGTHVAFITGEEVSVEDLLCGMMLASANDAAQGLAEAAAGSIEAFVDQMNDKAEELGALNSNFTNPSGYHDPALVSTAYDMALITRWALTVPEFRDYFGRWDYTIGPTNLKDESRNLGTYHSMIVGPENNPYFGYEGATGGKLGWTPEATHTIVTVADREGVELICVALKSTNQYAKYHDSIALFDYCFENFYYTEIPFTLETDRVAVTDDGKSVGEIELFLPEEPVKVLLCGGMTADDVEVSYSIPKTVDIGGSMEFTASLSLEKASSGMERELLTVELPAVFAASIKDVAPPENMEAKQATMPLWAAVLISVLGVAALLTATVLVVRWYNIKKHRRMKIKRRG